MQSIDEGSYLYKNKKYRPLEVEKKFFSVILFQRLKIFPILKKKLQEYYILSRVLR